MRFRIPVFALCVKLSLLCNCAMGVEQNIHALRSAYLYYFSYFITWPDDTNFIDNTFQLCAITDDPKDRYQLNTIENKSLGTHSLNINLFDTTHTLTSREATNCHMIYVSRIDNKRSLESIQNIAPSTLLVTEGGDSLKGRIHLFQKNNKLNFEINHNALINEGYKVSSKLLRLAKRDSK